MFAFHPTNMSTDYVEKTLNESTSNQRQKLNFTFQVKQFIRVYQRLDLYKKNIWKTNMADSKQWIIKASGVGLFRYRSLTWFVSFLFVPVLFVHVIAPTNFLYVSLLNSELGWFGFTVTSQGSFIVLYNFILMSFFTFYF